jgi:CYTH domain-containing protein
MADRTPGLGRYAHVEREQRWIAAGVPAAAVRGPSLLDRYIDGTRLRLRRAESGGEVIYKLGQKVRVAPDDPELLGLTNIYLARNEYEVLAVLAAAEVRKTRWHLGSPSRVFAVDEFHGRLAGLVLVEVELDEAEDRLSPPSFVAAEVTNDDRFSGGWLASMDDAATDELLAEAAARCRRESG